MKCNEIIAFLEKQYPSKYALDWDNVGLLIGKSDSDIKTIYVAVDANDDIIEDAIRHHADFIITHHPLIFSPLKRINDQNFISQRVLKLIEHGISLYAMHTNYDVVRMGDLAAEKIGLQKQCALEVTDLNSDKGIGQIGKLSESCSLKELSELVKKAFQLEGVCVFGDLDHHVKQIAISPGAGNSMIEHALHAKAEVLITGDISHHNGIDAVAQGLSIIDAGHYGIEHIFIQDVAETMESNFKDIEVIQEPIHHPFKIV